MDLLYVLVVCTSCMYKLCVLVLVIFNNCRYYLYELVIF